MTTTTSIVIPTPGGPGPAFSLVPVTDQLAATNTPLGASDTYTSGYFTSDHVAGVAYRVFSDQAGTLELQMTDGTSSGDDVWDTIETVDVTAETVATGVWSNVGGLMQIVYTNGDDAQTEFRLSAYATGALVDV
jgi:hypothetical protein